ncbi:MAG: hypothetical protein ACR2MD_17590 [Aridibacter sp.]
MQILNSGSFINTDNQEKIEQLKFTAIQLADATAEKDGFVNVEEAGKKLALEFWEGLEYMCRETEESAVKNIFLSHFLERLSELRKSENIAKSELPNDSKAKDEFLGIIAENSEDEDEETIIAEEAKAIMEESSRRTEDLTTLDNDSTENEQSGTADIVSSEPEIELSETLAKESSEKDKPNVDEKSQDKIVPEILHLSEKEPYQFDKCTVTATIQLLPTDSEKRRAVLSVKTHDFAPQITLHEIFGEANPEQLISALDKAFEKYKGDLPVKVMDKLRKEKSSGKKKKKLVKAKAAETSSSTTADNRSVSEPEVKADETLKSEVMIPQPSENLQGSLFGI